MSPASRAAAIGTVILVIDLAVACGVAFPEAFGFLAQPAAPLTSSGVSPLACRGADLEQ